MALMPRTLLTLVKSRLAARGLDSTCVVCVCVGGGVHTVGLSMLWERRSGKEGEPDVQLRCIYRSHHNCNGKSGCPEHQHQRRRSWVRIGFRFSWFSRFSCGSVALFHCSGRVCRFALIEAANPALHTLILIGLTPVGALPGKLITFGMFPKEPDSPSMMDAWRLVFESISSTPTNPLRVILLPPEGWMKAPDFNDWNSGLNLLFLQGNPFCMV